MNPTPARPEETFLCAKVDGSGNVVPFFDYTADEDIYHGNRVSRGDRGVQHSLARSDTAGIHPNGTGRRHRA